MARRCCQKAETVPPQTAQTARRSRTARTAQPRPFIRTSPPRGTSGGRRRRATSATVRCPAGLEGHRGRHGWLKPNYRRIGCRGGPRRSCRSARPLLSPGPLLLLPSLCATVRSCASRDTLQRSPAELQRRGALSTHRPPALSWL